MPTSLRRAGPADRGGAPTSLLGALAAGRRALAARWGALVTRWRGLDPRRRLLATAAGGLIVLGTAAVVALAGSGLLTGAAPTPTPSPSPTPTAPPSPSPSPSPIPTPSPSPTPSPLALGEDGRLTVLLLGSDYRPAKPGNRTDAMMVVSIDPRGAACMLGLPRDLVLVPLPDGTTWERKLNELLAWAERHPEAAPEGAFAYVERAIGSLLGLEIDAYVFSGFAGVRRVVDALGGVDIVLDEPVDDPYYWLDGTHRGVHFPAGPNHLDGKMALVFARTRKGDNDFERMRRQQMLVVAVVREALEAGPDVVARLVPVVRETLKTDLSLEQGLALYRLLARVDETAVEQAVLGPRRYAGAAFGPWGYGLEPDVAAIRGYVAAACPAVP